MSEDQKIYSLQQIEEWIEDALESEATPQEIYDTIIHSVEKFAIYHRACLNHSSRLLSLLEDNIVVGGDDKIEGYDDFELPLPKQNNVVRMSDYTEKDYWEGKVSGVEFNDALNRYGYEYTPITKDMDITMKDSPYNDGWIQQFYKEKSKD